ncbi:MAG: FHA domain-containing protein, partial [Planctomycetes bacterium]|nr:FHA domain-containing protein [Planctomycetota bacterium]
MPRLLVEKGPDRGKSVTVAVGAQLIAGRDKEAGLQLSDTMASRRHFMIASKSGIFGLKDLNSANGTLVNGRQSEGAHRLQYGDSIQVGETLMSWLADETGDKQGGL